MKYTKLLSLLFIFLYSGISAAQKTNQTFYEFIRYEVVNNSQMHKIEDYWKKSAIPAFNRSGIEMIGVFKPMYGAHGLDLFVVIPHQSLNSYSAAWDKLAKDEEYAKTAAHFINRTKEEPVFHRYSTTLLKAFTHMPKMEVPAHIVGNSERIFEMRTYESHSRHDSKMKIEMFNEGGEIALFRKTGLHPVFFGETVAGENMPNLVYMLGFENLSERDKNWGKFVSSKGWANMKDIPKYKDTVSGITDVILKPTAYSQM